MRLQGGVPRPHPAVVSTFADMVRDGGAETPRCESWADCVVGTVEAERYVEMLGAAGFHNAEVVVRTGYRTAPTTIGAIFRAQKPETAGRFSR
jgi:hypothetical protein